MKSCEGDWVTSSPAKDEIMRNYDGIINRQKWAKKEL